MSKLIIGFDLGMDLLQIKSAILKFPDEQNLGIYKKLHLRRWR
jgi:hypothetical protein